MENKIIDGQAQVCGGVSNSKGGKVGLVLGAVGVLGGIAAAALYKKKKNGNKVEADQNVENNDENIEE